MNDGRKIIVIISEVGYIEPSAKPQRTYSYQLVPARTYSQRVCSTI